MKIHGMTFEGVGDLAWSDSYILTDISKQIYRSSSTVGKYIEKTVTNVTNILMFYLKKNPSENRNVSNLKKNWS